MIYYEDDQITLCHGDVLDVLRKLPDDSLDSVVTDPPYGLEFMGKDWDAPWKDERTDKRGVVDPTKWGGNQDSPSGGNAYSRARVRTAAAHYRGDPAAIGVAFQAWCQDWLTECLRILKPGGYLLSFGGSRTFHRLACAIEDAGFEIRDSISWLYGSGFPKSMDVSKAIDKAAGAERKVVGVHENPRRANRATSSGTTAGMQALGPTGIKGGDHYDTAPATDDAKAWEGWGTALKPAWEPIVVARKPLIGTVANNVLAHGTGALNIDACRVKMGDDEVNPSIARYRNSTPQQGNAGWEHVNRGARFDEAAVASAQLGRWPANVLLDESQAEVLDEQTVPTKSSGGKGDKSGKLAKNVYGDYAGTTKGANAGGLGDEGGVSRYFPTFKYQAKASKKERPVVDGTAHPTVKPLDLMRWLVKLVTPPGGWVLDPFAGSGTTGEAALAEGFCCVLVEREADYLPLIMTRLDRCERGVG